MTDDWVVKSLNVSSLTFCLQGVPKNIWKLGKLNHVAIAVPDIDKATAFYRDILGAKVSEKYVCIIHLIQNIFLLQELVEN